MNRVLKNIFSLVTGQIIILILNLLSITLAARFLGVENFGRFSTLLAIITIISKVFDLGFPAIVFRELSLRKNEFKIFNTSIIITLSLFFLTAIVFNIVLLIIKVSSVEILLLNVLLVNTLFSIKYTNMRELLQTPFKVELKMHVPVTVGIIDNIIFLVLVILIPTVNGGLTYFIFSYVVSNIPGFFLMLFLLDKNFTYRLKFEIKDYLWLIKEALPIYGYLVFDVLLQQADILLLQLFHSDYEVGVYSVALRYVAPLIFIPSAVVQSLLPSITKNRDYNPAKNNAVFRLTLKVFFYFSVSIALIMLFKSEEVIVILLGINYTDSALPLSILFLCQFFIYFNFFSFNMFIAYGKQKIIFGMTILLFLMNVGLNLLIIPNYSFIGSAFVKFLTVLIGAMVIIKLLKTININAWFVNFRLIFWLIGFSSFLYLFSGLNLIFYGIASVSFSVIMAIILKCFSYEEIYSFAVLMNKGAWLKKILHRKENNSFN